MLYGDVGSCGSLCNALAGRLRVPGEQLVQLMALGSPGHEALQHVIVTNLVTHRRYITGFQLPTTFPPTMAPSAMSVRRDSPRRHMTVLPGGGSLARAR